MAELPEDILLKVFEYLPPRELLIASGVCSAWRGVLAASAELWQRKVLIDRRPALLHPDGATEQAEHLEAPSARRIFLFHGLNIGWRDRRIATTRKLYSVGQGEQCVWEFSNHPAVLLQPPWILITPVMASPQRTCALLLVNMDERPFHVAMRAQLGQAPPLDQPLSRLDQHQFDRQTPLRRSANSHMCGRTAESLGGQPSADTVSALQFPLIAQTRDSWDSWAPRGSCADVWHFGHRHPVGEVEMESRIIAMAFEANPNYDVCISTLPPSGVLLAAATASEVRVWQLEGENFHKTISLRWDSKTDDVCRPDPSLQLPDSTLSTVAIWSTDRMTSPKRSRFSIAVGHACMGITVLQMEQYKAESGLLATPKAGRASSAYLHGDLRWRVQARQRVELPSLVQQIHISYDKEFTHRQPAEQEEPNADQAAASPASSAIINARWELAPLHVRTENMRPRPEVRYKIASYDTAKSHYQMGLVTMHALVRPGPHAAPKLSTESTVQETGQQAITDALSRLKMGHRKGVSLHGLSAGARQFLTPDSEDEANVEMAAQAAAILATVQDNGVAGPTGSSEPKVASCRQGDVQYISLSESIAADADEETIKSALASASGRSTANLLEAAGSSSSGGAELNSETPESSLCGSAVEEREAGQEDAKPRCQTGVPPQVAAGCCRESTSVWCFQLWPGGLTPGDPETECGKEGFRLKWHRATANASSVSVGEGLTAVACADGNLLLLETATGHLVRQVPNAEVDHCALNKGPRLPCIAACSAWVGSLGGASRGAHLLSLTELAYLQGGLYQYELSAILHHPREAEEVQCLCAKAAVLRLQKPAGVAHLGREAPGNAVRSFYCCANRFSRLQGDKFRPSCSFLEYVT